MPAQAVTRIAREFAAERRGHQGPIDDHHGRRRPTIGSTPTPSTGRFLMLTTITGCQGVNGGGWAHYVGPGEGAPDHRLGAHRVGVGLESPGAADDPDRLLVPAHRPIPLRQLRRLPPGRFDGDRQVHRDGHRGRHWPCRRGWAGCRRTPRSTATPSTLPTRLQASRPSRPASTSSSSSSPANLGFAGEDPDAPENFPRVLTIWRANLLGSSGKGNEYFLKHLLGTDSSVQRA